MIDVQAAEQWNGDRVKELIFAAVKGSSFEIGLKVEGYSKSLTPVKSGRLRGSITTQSADRGTTPDAAAGSAGVIQKPADPQETHVGTVLDYAPWIEFGTGPFKITVKNAKVLTDGKTFFGKSVNHPGIKAQPFLRPALDMAKGGSTSIVQENFRRELGDYLV